MYGVYLPVVELLFFVLFFACVCFILCVCCCCFCCCCLFVCLFVVVWGGCCFIGLFLFFGDDVPLVEFLYLVFTRMPGESYRRLLKSFLLCLCNVFFKSAH